MNNNSSRRNAIKNMVLTGSGLTFLPLLSTFKKKEDKRLGIALVGLGNYATNQLAPALQHTQFCKLQAIVTGTPEKAIKWQKDYNIELRHTYNYQNYDNIKNDSSIDIVYIVLPNFMHKEYTIRALNAGKHVICEKPMGMNAAECKAMINAAKENNKMLQVGYRLYYEPHHLKLMEESKKPIENGIKIIESSLGFQMARPGLWRIDKKMGGGGALMDLGIYTIQAARRAVGHNPVSVTAQAFKDDPELYKDIYGTYVYQLHFEDNTVCNSMVSFSGYSDRFHVARGNEYLELQPAFAANQIGGLSTWNNQQEVLTVAEYQQTTQMDAFAKNILNKTPVLASGEEGLIDMQIIDTIKKAIASGEKERIEY